MRNYQKSVRRTENRRAYLSRVAGILHALRLVSFLSVVLVPVAMYYIIKDIEIIWPVLSAGPFLIVFVFLVVRSLSIRDLIRECDMQIEEYRSAEKRFQPHWADLLPYAVPEDKTDPAGDHPYAADLDFTGRYSFFQYLDRTVTAEGKRYLYRFLLNLNTVPPGHGEEMRRKIRLISRKRVFMFRFRRKGRFLSERLSGNYKSNFIKKMKYQDISPPVLDWLIPFSAVLAGITSITLIFSALPQTPPLFFFTVPVQILLFALVHATSSRSAEKLKGLSEEAALYAELSLSAERDKSLCSVYPVLSQKPSEILKKFITIASWYSLRQNPLLYFSAGILFQHELYLNRRLRKWLAEGREKAVSACETVAQIDAEVSLAQFAFDNPDYVYPEYASGGNHLIIANDLNHILLPRNIRIGNSFVFDGNERLWILTGSNMSGKSTFMRTVASSLLLAEAGIPLPASQFAYRPLKVFSSMRISDDMEHSVSGFYGEIRRIRMLLDSLNQAGQKKIFYLIDEMFRGTNTRERIIAAKSVIKVLLNADCCGIISTHDPELTVLCDENKTVRCMHFEETVKNDVMHFDYRLKEGPVRSSNALKILEKEGIQISYE